MKKRIISMLLALFMVVGLLPPISLAADAATRDFAVGCLHEEYGDNGFCVDCDAGYEPATLNDADVYEIANGGNLFWFAQQVNGGKTAINGILTADIDLEGRQWMPIGSEVNVFTGTFDGGEHSISGLRMEITESGDWGLFGYVSGATIQNFSISGEVECNLTAKGDSEQLDYGVIGEANEGAVISNIHSSVNFTNKDLFMKNTVGGILGKTNSAGSGVTVDRCSFSGTMDLGNGDVDCCGGIVGYCMAGHSMTITNCGFYGTITSTHTESDQIGGIMGYYRMGKLTVQNCLSVGTISTLDSTLNGAVMGILRQHGTANTMVSNNYYAGTQPFGNSSANDDIVEGYGSQTVEGSATAKTDFANGEVAYLLGEAWGQSLGVDAVPVIEGEAVYQILSCMGNLSYSNTDSDGHDWKDATCTKPKTCEVCGVIEGAPRGHSFDENGVCIACGKPVAASITREGVTTRYTSLADAAAAVSEGETIDVLADVTVAEGETLAFAAYAYLAVAEGKTITCEGIVTITGKAGIIFENTLYYYGGDRTEQGIIMLDADRYPIYFTAGEGYACYYPADGETASLLCLYNATVLGSDNVSMSTSYESEGVRTYFHGEGNLHVKFFGENTVKGRSGYNGSFGIKVNGDLILEGAEGAILHVGSGLANNTSRGIDAKNVYITGGTVNIYHGDLLTEEPPIFVAAYGENEHPGKISVSPGATLNLRDNGILGSAVFAAGTVEGEFDGLYTKTEIDYEAERIILTYCVYGHMTVTEDSALWILDVPEYRFGFAVPADSSLTVQEGVTVDLSAMTAEHIVLSGTVTNNGILKFPADFELSKAPKGGVVFIGERSFLWNGEKWICNDDIHDWMDATCAAPKTCSICGKTEGEVSTEHKFVTYPYPDATCTEPGIEVSACTVCGYSTSRELPAKGHSMAKTVFEPSCTSDGYIYNYCRNCSYSEEVPIAAPGHMWDKATCVAPETCSSCNETRGEIASTHTSLRVVDTVDGVHQMHCDTCGADYTVVHEYKNGFCDNGCGYEMPPINENGYYEISNGGQLFWYAEWVNVEGRTGEDVILIADIDLENRPWTPIGTNLALTCVFDGNGHRIDNLYIPETYANTGLIGNLSYGGVKDLTVSGNMDITITDTYGLAYVGLLVGRMDHAALINCHVEGSLTAVYAVGDINIPIGGLVGATSYCPIVNCSADVDMNVTDDRTHSVGKNWVGGLIGEAIVGNENGEPPCILNSYAVGDITVDVSKSGVVWYVGGIAGYVRDDAVNNFYKGNISVVPNANTYVGYAFGMASNCAWVIDSSNTSNKTLLLIQYNYYPSGETGIGIWNENAEPTEDAVTAIPTEGFASDAMVSMLNNNLAYTNEIVMGHLGFLSESEWQGIVNDMDGANVYLRHWVAGDQGYPVFCENDIDLVTEKECGLCNAVSVYARLQGRTLSLNGDIAINYYMELSDEVLADPTAYMQFIMADGEIIKIPVSEGVQKVVEGRTSYVFTCEVNAKEMTDEVISQFFYEGGAAEFSIYSVRLYAEHILANSSDENVKALVTAMLHYGAASQIHFDYATDRLANAGMETPDYSGVTIDGFITGAGQGTALAKFYAASLILKSETTLRFFFQVDSSVTDLTVTYMGQTLEVKERSGLHYADVEGISAKALDENVTITISDGIETADISFNPMSYCHGVLEDTTGAFDGKMKDLVAALYLYNQAANVYFEES